MNMKAKKILVAVLLVAVLVAGTAYAGGRKRQGGHGGRTWSAPIGGGMCESCGARFETPHGGRRRGGINVPEVPQEIRDKLTEARKIAIDLRAELEKSPVDREKALEFHAKHRALMQEISDWYFNRRLDALTAR